MGLWGNSMGFIMIALMILVLAGLVSVDFKLKQTFPFWRR